MTNEEFEDLNLALYGFKYKLVLEELHNYLRTLSKYDDKTSIKIEVIRAKIIELESQYFNEE